MQLASARKLQADCISNDLNLFSDIQAWLSPSI
jgi:hypothetical protein